MEDTGLLCQRLALQRGDAFKISGALALVFSTGLALLQAALGMKDPVLRQARLLQQLATQLPLVSCVLLVAVHPQHQAAAAAAFARTVGRPQAVLPWLLAVSQGLMHLRPTSGRCTGELQS